MNDLAWSILWFVWNLAGIIASKGTDDIRPLLIAIIASSVSAIAAGRTYQVKLEKPITLMLLVLFGVYAGFYIYDKHIPNFLTVVPVICLWISIRKTVQEKKRLRTLMEQERINREASLMREIEREMAQERSKAEAELRYERKKRVNQMTGVEFENYCAGYLLKVKGFKEVRTTNVTGDFGADLIGIDGQGIKWVVQCKRYVSSVSNSAVQEVVAAKAHYGASRGMVMTNSYLTRGAKKLAYENRIEVIERMT